MDTTKAQKILLGQWELAKQKSAAPKTKSYDNISAILNGSHKTYKYILITACLAKATDSSVNALSLQAGAPIDGAYDARSLCHTIVVDFERTYLGGVVGASNEPFLNKPARFTHLSTKNAVRSGNDERTLKRLISVCNDANSNPSVDYLFDCLLVLNNLLIQKNSEASIQAYFNPKLFSIKYFLTAFCSQSYQGVTLTAATYALFEARYQALEVNVTIHPHKINQAGSSSKEICDIDIYQNKAPIIGIEIKDKPFTISDLDHVYTKCKKGQVSKCLFVYGPHACLTPATLNQLENSCFDRNIKVSIVNIFDLFNSFYCDFEDESPRIFSSAIFECLEKINANTDVKQYAHDVFEELEWGK